MTSRRAGLFTWVLLLCSFARSALCAPVTIDTAPPGAAVYVDGKEQGPRGYTASTFRVVLRNGPHKLLLELDGYKPVEQTIIVTKRMKLFFQLERSPAKLDVRFPATNDGARDADLFIDGTTVGTVPREVEVSPGSHLIEVRKTGFKVYSDTIEVKPAEKRILLVSLQSDVRYGSLLVGSSTPGDVYVDGQPRGQAPALVDQLTEGDHQVEVRGPDADATPWRQSVKVVAGQQLRVLAEGKPPAPKTGSLLILTQAGADITIDGSTHGTAGQEITNLRPGQHVVVVQLKGYNPKNSIVEVEAGKQRVEKIDLHPSAEGRGVGILRIIRVNPIDGADYYVNGKKVPEEIILSDKGVEVAAGTNIVVVRKEGFGSVTRQTSVTAGGKESVSVELRNVGKAFITSTPPGAQILVDQGVVGQTPYSAEDVPAGQHLIELRLPGFQPYVQQVLVRGGEQINVNAQMGLAPIEALPLRPQPQASFSALVNDPGHFTFDLGGGYPYFTNLRLTVGAIQKGKYGLDGGVDLRTTFYTTDVNLILRAQIYRVGPLVIGANLLLGGGGGPRQRNEFAFEFGVPLTLLAGRYAHVTFRPYVQVYSDRLCPGQEGLLELAKKGDLATLTSLFQPEHAGDRCTGGGDANFPNGYPNAIQDAAGYVGPGQFVLPGDSRYRYSSTSTDYQVLGNPVLERFTGVRFFLQAVVEIAVTRSVNLWGLIEGAPFQEQRQSFTDKFNRVFPFNDLPLYGRVGFTVKF